MANKRLFETNKKRPPAPINSPGAESTSSVLNDEHPRTTKDASFKAKFKRIVRNSLIALIILIIVVFGGFTLSRMLPVWGFHGESNRNFKIPYLSKGYIPQGLAYDSASGDFYLSGYMADGSPSLIFIVDKETKKVEKRVAMANSNGEPLNIHSGGIAIHNGMVYVCGDDIDCLYVYDPASIRSAKNGDLVPYVSTVDLSFNADNIHPAYVFSNGGNLYVGEFYKKGVYDTLSQHHVDTEDGTQCAFLVELNIDPASYAATPISVTSTVGLVQGAKVYNNELYLSTSWGIATSKIYRYDTSKLTRQGTHRVLGSEVPLYIADSTALIDVYKIAPMSEEIEVVDNKMYIQCESASKKYFFGKLTGANRVYTIDIEKLNALND